MRDLSPVAHRASVSVLVLGLLIPAFPLHAAAAEDEPVPVTEAFEITGDASEATAAYAWTITSPDELWHLEAVGPADEHVRLVLKDGDGLDLGHSSAGARAALFDLALAPGTYGVEILDASREDYVFELRGSREPERFDPEPNDRFEDAVLIEDGAHVPGRLARVGGDTDHFGFSIAPGDELLRDITLLTGSEQDRELCLLTPEAETLQCRRASELPLRDLALDPGDYVVRVRGSVDEGEPYELLLETTRARAADYEAEPNDVFVTASPIDAVLGVSGRSHYHDEDVHALEVEAAAQLWRIEASGGQIDYLRWIRAGNDVIAQASPRCDGTSAVLEDLFLVPGTHRFLVRTCDGEYEIEATPMGLPDPEAEREPNSDELRAEPYGLGQRRTGRVPSLEDYDYFRFTLAAPELVELQLQQSADADIRATLYTRGSTVSQLRAREPGTNLAAQFFLQPGDYLLQLRNLVASDGLYELTTTPLDAWDVPPDAEPNDTAGFARAAPASLRWSGSLATREDGLDAVWLPALAAPGPVHIAIDGGRPSARLFHGPNRNERVELERQDDGSFVAADAPTGVPLYLEIITDGDYEVTVDAPGWDVPEAPDPLPVAVELTAAAQDVAAYWPEGQRVDATITLVNEGEAALDLDLVTRSSHYAWTLEPGQAAVTLAPGASESVPAVIETRADLWANAPVRLYVTAVAADGGYVTGATSLDASPEAEAVGSHLAWPVPLELAGGLNVAGAALGGVPANTVQPDRELFLYDDVTPAGAGFGVGHDGSPLELIVDLAGDAPLPVAGTILNPLARGGYVDDTPRDFELALSTDGQTWQTVLREELTPLPIDQAFVFDEPRDATHARLRIDSTHGTNPDVKSISLGEWKVIAVPGAVPDDMPANIAEPVRGGHIARLTPFINGTEHWRGILDDELRRRSHNRDREAGETMELVVGFQEGRAAQITGLRWQDPEGTQAEGRAEQVEVAVTTGGPLGPWRALGTWGLERAEDGSVAPFELEAPEWARYVRVTAPTPPPEIRAVEFPGVLEVLERPTDAEYRSILAEWGYTSDRGPFEVLEPSAASEVTLGEDAGDTQETALSIALGETHLDRAQILEDVDWLRITVPDGHNTLSVELEGIPSVGVTLTLVDADGRTQELRREPPQQGRESYHAVVEPGDHYLLVEQPPFSVAFTFDTSGSMGPYLDFVFEGMRVFASDVEPGREVAMIFPFDRPALLDAWQDQPALLEAAVNDFVPYNESSNVEIGLLDSAQALSGREGTRAILAVADAETGSLDRANEVWAAFGDIEPRVYTVHVGAESQPEQTRNLMRAWSDTNNGVYSYPTTHAEMERAFERMSTHLRRPSTYALTASTEFVDTTPGSLAVIAPLGQTLGLAGDTAVGVILDTSGSMRKTLGGKTRIAIAKTAVRELLGRTLEEGTDISLRVFGESAAAGCQTRQLLPLGPLDRQRALAAVKKLKAPKKVKTPIADALLAVASDLEGIGTSIVVLITDGDETCGGDPIATIESLKAAGIDTTVNIVGFALDNEVLKAKMDGWAQTGGGTYYDASDASALGAAITSAVAAPVDIYRAGEHEQPVATTTVGGEPVELAPGEYRIEVRSSVPQEVEGVVIPPGQAVTLELEGTPEE